MSLEIISSGFLTLLQDIGRYGFARIAITQGGPLDEHAFLWANRILDNDYNAPQLEISFGGFAAKFHKATTIALCGADLSATINGKSVDPWQSYKVLAGDEIRCSAPKSGLRCYLAIAGGFEITQVLNSSATVVRESLGGLNKDGSAIAKGDILSYGVSDKALHKKVLQAVPCRFVPHYTKSIELRFIKNPFLQNLDAFNKFVEQSYSLSQKIDRMGYCLSGEALDFSKGIISQGISLGAIQVPSDGQPIVLMKDRQTMGGYPQVGCVAYLDLPLLAQSMPGTKVKFIPVELQGLEAELLEYKSFFNLPI